MHLQYQGAALDTERYSAALSSDRIRMKEERNAMEGCLR